MSPTVSIAQTAEETALAGRQLASKLAPGDLVLFIGELGAGKTTMIRGILEELGHEGAVRSPTFNLIQTFSTRIPVMHADLYRLTSSEGLGLEDYFETHLCLIEWPDRLSHLPEPAWRVELEFSGNGRLIKIQPPDTKF